MSAHGTFTDVLAAHWSDDFAPLQDAGEALLAALREDENAPDADLYRRIGAFGNGSHHYFGATEPLQASMPNFNHAPTTPLGMLYQPANVPASDPPPTIRMKHDLSIPLPSFISQQQKLVKNASMMGLMPQAELAWLSVDDKLFIWPYSSQNASGGPSFCSFTVRQGQCVLSVGLAPPKEGVFLPSVKWCLIVTTAEEVILCALASSNREGLIGRIDDNQTLQHRTGAVRLVPTRFSVPTDNVRMLCVCGAPDGRIFLGGEDGCLYEMAYDNPDHLAAVSRNKAASSTADKQLEQFYDHGKQIPGIISETTWNATRKRLLPSSVYRRPRKCQKLNHSSRFSTVIPDFLIKATSFLLGAGISPTGGGGIVKMVVDEERSCLYTLGSKGWICAFNLLCRGKERSAGIVAVMNAPETARLYLEAVAQQRMTAPNSNKQNIGNITFAGGGSAAQKGVGGMEGARNILSLAKLNGNSHNLLMPISLHVVPQRESGRITLVAVTRGGLRYFISSLSADALLSGASMSNGTTETFSPSASRLSLCHIRAPPPLEVEVRTQGIATGLDIHEGFPVGGFVPQMSNKANKMPSVDASFCGGGAMVLAVEQRRAQNAPREASIGDHIVAMAPDFVLRKSKDSYGGAKKISPGGVSETLSLPLSQTSSTDNARLLDGGIVSDIAQTVVSESSLMKLALNSRTPSDAELSVGLVPEFVPDDNATKSCIRGETAETVFGGGNCSDIVFAGSRSLTFSAIAVAFNFVPKLLLPLRHTVRLQQPYRAEQKFRAFARYHTSQRYGTEGFSLTAADIPANRRQVTATRKSPRLNPWLLQPARVPLNPLALQHIMLPTQIVVMNSGGLHYFKFVSILTAFEEAIIAAGENVEYDKWVTSFFSSYGYAEGCAMCVMLALGIGTGGVNKRLKDFAGRAVNTRAYSPKLMPAIHCGDGPIADSLLGSDPLLPMGYCFRPSALLDGVVKVAARLLRPVWCKPLVVVTEGRTVSLKWKNEKRLTPSKVELLLEDATLGYILHSLSALAELMQVWFKQAIECVPGMLRTQCHMIEMDEPSDQNLAITDAFSRQSHLRDSSGVGYGLLAPAEAERLAKLTEERKIHSIFRLVSRSQQLLQLFALLSRAQRTVGLPEVQWGSLHGLTVSQLVQTRDGHDRVGKILNKLVTITADFNLGLCEPCVEADHLANELTEKCYLYFSPGSRYAYFGFSFGHKALACHEGSARQVELVAMATKNFQRAAKHWHSASLVAGRSLHIRDQELYEDVARAAFIGDSPVAKAASLLAELNEVVALVDVCLATAANFGMKLARATGVDDQVQSKTLHWENELYHKRQEAQESSKAWNGVRLSMATSPSSRTLTLGTTVTAQDAMTTCWFLIFYHLTLFLQGPERRHLAVKMVSRCASEPAGPFLNAFFRHLKESGNTETLLQIASASAEQWLRDFGQDQNLLYKYYCIQGDLIKAGTFALRCAKDDSRTLPFGDRIKWLSNAIGACSGAKQNTSTNDWSNWGSTSIETEARDLLDIAKLQLRVLETTTQSQLTEEHREMLTFDLMKATCLFDVAYSQGSNEICLLLLHTCKENDATYIKKLWRNVICEAIFPCSTRDKGLHDFLVRYLSQSDFASEYNQVLLLDSDSTSDEPRALFEEGLWMKTLEMKIASLGRDLYGKGADFVFPVPFLLSELESLRWHCKDSSPAQEVIASQAWSLKVLTCAGVRFTEVLNAWERLTAQDENKQLGLLGIGDVKNMDRLTGILSMLRDWIRAAHEKPERKQELSQAYHSFSLSDKMRMWNQELMQMNAVGLLQSLKNIEAELERLLGEGRNINS